MSWTLIDTATERDAVLELYGKHGMFMIRANGLELMSGFCHESETALGALAARLAPTHEPRILVGGLGLGYTAASLIDALCGRGTVTIVELSGTVIDWFHRHVKTSVMPDGASLTIVQADVADAVRGEDRFDVIVLDVDNGPEPLVTAGNAALYSAEGLRALHASLSDHGVALLWSGFESAEFAARAKEVGFVVTCEPFQRVRDDLSHFIYALAKNPATTRNAATISRRA